jgi:hypothetical protein
MLERFDRFRDAAPRWWHVATAAALAVVCAAPAWADGGVTFSDIAAGGGAGITYQRTPSVRFAGRQAMIDSSPIPFASFQLAAANHPAKPAGAPGVALLDYDGDGDTDIYVTNGPGTPNSLYSNQLVETGSTTFVDVGLSSGAGLTDQDSSGVCFGDIDNDGDPDLFVLGSGDPYRLLENQGDGTFADVSAGSGATGPGGHWAVACSMADFDADGLLDIIVANTYDSWNHRLPIVFGLFPGLQHNDLFMNAGGNTFTEEGAARGLHQVSNMPDAAFTWAIGAVDLDEDGDMDIVSVDNQGRPPADQSEERGYPRFFQNDGTGNFTDVTFAAELDQEGGWMGIALADYDCNGWMDFFSTNLGNYLGGVRAPSSFFLGHSDGTWSRLGYVELGGNVFGWGTSPIDYDNDGDFDLIYHGSIDNVQSVVNDNPGVLYRNNGACTANFTYDGGAILRDHRTRTVNGVAVGDLDNDGFDDIVSVSNFNVIPFNFFPWVPFIGPPRSPTFDSIARAEVEWFPLIPGHFVWVEPSFTLGDLAVELNSGNGNNSVQFAVIGGVDLVTGGTVNRSGIGVRVAFTPDGGLTAAKPIVGGSSYASQDSLVATFGLGAATRGTVDVYWPGGAHNRVYDVQAGERLLLPEIPCSFDDSWGNFGLYNSCVMQALNGYLAAGKINAGERNRLRDSAWRAYHESL